MGSTGSVTAARIDERTNEASQHIDGVLIVGGGYAGLHAARAASRAGHTVTVLDRRDTHDFVTRLAAVAGGGSTIVRADRVLGDFQPNIEVGILDAVHDGAVTLSDGRTISADAVIISAGSRPTQPPIEGIELALPLRSAEHAIAIRTALETATSLVVIGGGATGVQISAAVAHQHPHIDVHVVDFGSRLLGPMSKATGDGARRILESRGAHVHLDAKVERITSTGVDVSHTNQDDGDDDGEDGDDGGDDPTEQHISGLVVWAGGFEARADELGVDVSADGRILVQDDLRIMGMTHTFAAGDVAAHLDPSGAELPMSAQIAVQAGGTAGQNAARLLDGLPTKAGSLAQRGWVLDLGGGRGLAEFGPVALSIPFADLVPPLLHKLIDLKVLFGMGGTRALTW